MSVSDLIADQLTVIRNGIRVGKKSVTIKKSNMLEGIMEIIKREKFIDNYKVIQDEQQGRIKVYLKYADDGKSVIEDLQKVSKPGRRIYVSGEDAPSVMGGVGISVMSTNKGLLTDAEAREQGIGGEVICKIW